MSLESILLTKRYSGDGATLAFSFPYAFINPQDLDVYLVAANGIGTLKTLNTDYTVAGSFNPASGLNDDYTAGGTVTFIAAPTNVQKVFIVRDNPDTQDTSLINDSKYSSKVVEAALDKEMMVTQFVKYRASRALRLADEVDDSAFNSALFGTIPANAIPTTNPTATGWVWAPDTTITNQYVGVGAIPEKSFNFANNQVSPANITGLAFDPTVVRSVEIDIQFYRVTTSTGATELSARAKYLGTYKSTAGTWEFTCLGFVGDADASTGNPAGVGVTITSAGQCQYISSNISGTASQSVMHYRANVMGV